MKKMLNNKQIKEIEEWIDSFESDDAMEFEEYTIPTQDARLLAKALRIAISQSDGQYPQIVVDGIEYKPVMKK